MKLLLRLLAALTALVALGASPLTRAATTAADATPPLLLISMDGFRWNYCAQHPVQTPNLRRLMQDGVSARGLIPVFPSNTFPNHYSIVTGLYPSHHGIINNHQFDARLGAFFHYNQAASVQDERWWQGEPIWVTAVKQGRKSACSFWVGSEARIEGTRPTYWKRYDPKLAFAPREEELLRWLALPPAERPAVITFYFEETNSAGHHFGPESPELVATVQRLDAQFGDIRRRVEALRLPINIIVVSDHGMTTTGPDQVILLDDYIDLATVQVDFDESTVGLRPAAGGSVDAIMRSLQRLPAHAKAYRAAELPARFHIDPSNPRVPPVWILPDEGWEVLRRSEFAATKDRFIKGQHGYDPALPDMRGILIAAGPSFKATGEVIDEVENVHIYNLLCAALHLRPAPNDGDDRLVRAMLK